MDAEATVWWLQEAPPDDAAPPLARDLEADVAIVGGGYCGLWTARALKERAPNLRVVLVEAERCGHGPSGRNGGFVHGYWSMLGWARSVLGDARALELARAGDGILPAVRELGEDVWLREAGMLEVATTPNQERVVAGAADTAHELGVQDEAVRLSRDEVAARCHSPRFGSGVLFRECATVQPARLAHALRRRALDEGVEVFEHTPATRVRGGVVETPNGTIRAGEIVLATNSELARWRPTARRLAEFRSYVVLTEPVPELIDELGWTGGEAIADGRMFLHYFRTTNDGRVLMGSAGGTRRHAERGLRLLLPALADARITHHGKHGKYKAIARQIAYHGTTFGALSINGIEALREPFEPLVPEVRHVSNTNRYHRPPEESEEEFTRFLLEELEQTIIEMGPETVCLVHMEPVQNAGGAFTPPAGYWQGVRELCDRYDILLSADEVITGFGRVGDWFGSARYDIKPDLVCCAKGLSSSYAAIGAVIARDAVMEPFMQGDSVYMHGITFGGHPVMSAIALKNIEIMKRDKIVEGVREHEDAFRSTLAQLLELPIVGDLRGTGFFYALELVKDKETRETFNDEECEWLLRDFLSSALFERGLICRADDRGDPVIQISPPLVARQEQFDEMVGILGDVLAEAGTRLKR